MKRSAKSRTGVLEQTTFLSCGIVETVWNQSKENVVLVSAYLKCLNTLYSCPLQLNFYSYGNYLNALKGSLVYLL